MQKKTFKLSSENNTPFEIIMDDTKNETHALLRILRENHCKSLNLVLSNETANVEGILPAKPYNQIDLTSYLKFTISGNFVTVAESYLEIEIHTGTWEEMVLSEVELSFSNSPFYISCKSTATEFMIGAEDESRMEVKPDVDGGFSVLTTIVHAPSQISQIQHHIPQNTEGAQVIGRLYGRIKGRINGEGFHERQEENKLKYAENFHKTLTEGFHEIVKQ